MPARLALPIWTGAEDDAVRARVAIDGWAGSSQISALVDRFGGSVATRDPAELLDWLDEFSGEHWDFRGGVERNLAPRVTLPPGVEQLVFDVAPVLGMAGPYPLLRTSYDTILMTGGMIRAEIVKPRFARELLDSGVAARNIVFLGGFRTFAGDERELAPVFGVNGDNEFDAMVQGMQCAFGGPRGLPAPEITGSGSDSVPDLGEGNGNWRVCEWVLGNQTLRVVAAPSSDPEHRRANTADTYRFWADRVRGPGEHSVLVATTPIYVPYQGAGAVEILGVECGLAVETVGASASASDLGEYSQVFLAQNHLQEIRSAIRALRSLRTRLTTGETRGSWPSSTQ
ncbi:MAG: hypothetical protein ABI053_09395 [Lacisediminihabitans sp.]